MYEFNLFYARSIRPDFKQDVQILTFLAPPAILALTDLMLGFHFFLVLRWE
jgi:hypothetical protein